MAKKEKKIPEYIQAYVPNKEELAALRSGPFGAKMRAGLEKADALKGGK